MQTFSQLPSPRKLDAGRGKEWCLASFRIVREQALTWVLLTLVYLLINFGVGLVPVIGNIAGALMGPIFAAGFVLAAQKADRGEELELADLFAGFRLMPGPLLLLGAMMFGLIAAASVLLIVFGVSGGVSAGLLNTHLPETAHSTLPIGFGLVFFVVIAAVTVVISLAYWFAPALVALNGAAPWQAIRSSFAAGQRNWLPMLVAGLIMLLLLIPVALTLGLGLLLWFPIASVIAFVSWKDIFADA
ncbi:BPSS1780 family membrane protein [Chromobacterium sp. IIBBL 290-4]|uniref:BPSS1780 family membrane protein n=1 Tax=Chromobacterium sp. IIBBL 290-4 TaxID=2953890 RepID=UPI0020B64424|nr:BPSS1780 family membrane protein [Chromobacterium sp. IIBBL 290-4]UTH75847.1 hypothetical protein NKT35_07020 [Chromobacterium sp. IIBBL 290-4]